MPEVNIPSRSGLWTSPWLRWTALIALAWSLCLGLSFLWNLHQARQGVLAIATRQAQTAFDTDLLYRRWNAGHGGVYVPVTPETPPNPHLAHLPERDIETPSGRPLTLMNPAYMLRQFHELARQHPNLRGHITSLKPLRPQNAPDPWERRALEAFERGTPQVTEVQDLDGSPYLRLMRPLATEAPCLACHAQQGYRVGDLRGGISVGIPLAPLFQASRTSLRYLALGHLAIWILGLVGLGLGAIRMHRLDEARTRAERELRELNAELEGRVQRRTASLETARSEMEAFSYSVSHDLRAPLRRIDGFLGVLREEMGEELHPQCRHTLERIAASTLHMEQLIQALLLLSQCSRRDLLISDVDTQALVEEVIQELQSDGDPREIRWVRGELPVLRADHHLLRQLFLNLIGNALKYTRSRHPAEIRIEGRLEAGGILFRIQDNGVGFEMAQADRLFGVFQRLHSEREFEGMGIGLALCSRIVQRHGGTIWAEGTPGQGAVFSFRLPAQDGR